MFNWYFAIFLWIRGDCSSSCWWVPIVVPLYPVDVALVASVGMTRCPLLIGILLISFNCSPIRGCRLGSFGRNDAVPPLRENTMMVMWGLRIAVEHPPRVPHMCGRRRRRMQNLSQGGGRRRNSPMGRWHRGILVDQKIEFFSIDLFPRIFALSAGLALENTLSPNPLLVFTIPT